MATLGVVIFSLQGMKHLDACLESVQWADALTLFHAGDKPPAIPSGLAVAPRVFRWQAGSDSVPGEGGLATDWILHLWGEERVDGSLKEALQAFRRDAPSGGSSGCLIRVRSYILGRWVDGSLWEPTPAERLKTRVGTVSAGWWFPGVARARAKVLPGWIEDLSTAQLSDGMDRTRSMAELWREQLKSSGAKLNAFSMWRVPSAVFFRLLFRSGLLKRGFAAFTFSTLAAYAVFLSGAKLWESRRAPAVKDSRAAGPKT